MTTENGNYQLMKEVFKSLGDYELLEKRGGRFIFTFHLPADKEKLDLECLDLSIRSFHGLKRRGYETIGDLVHGIWNGDNIKHIRGCGAKSYAEIMEKLFLWNLANIPNDKQIDYLMEVVEKNKKTE